MTIAEIRLAVRKQIAYYVEQDLKGDELLMKEVYEQLDGKDEHAICDDEMRRIIKWLREQP